MEEQVIDENQSRIVDVRTFDPTGNSQMQVKVVQVELPREAASGASVEQLPQEVMREVGE